MNMQQMVGDSKCRSRPYYFRRCKKERPTTIDSLPDELLFSILVGMPADYLHDRARLVCRRWYHIIRSKSFIDAHHQRSTYCLLSSEYGSGRPILMITATPQGLIQKNEFSYTCRDKFVGTCNGLMLEMLSCENNIIILRIINPATKQALVLPPFTAPAGTTTNYNTYCGIRYAAASMKYKVVISLRTSSPFQGLAILSIGVDNSWRQVRVDHLSEHERTHLSEGFMHWVDQFRGEMVVTLHVETEILTPSELVSSPPENFYKRNFYLSTGRSISLLIGRGENMRNFFELWEMNLETNEWMKLKDDIKLGDQYQQLRLQQLGFRSGKFMPHGWLKYPEVLVFFVINSPNPHSIMSYNLDTHEISSIDIPPLYDIKAMYKNSLLWLT